MAVDPLVFEKPQAYSAFDFTPLANLGAVAQKYNQDQQLANLAQRMGPTATPTSTTSSVFQTGSAPFTSGTPYTGDKQQVAQTVTKELRDQGFSDNAIAGILYNIGQESSFNPNLRHPDQPRYSGEAHYAHGLYQEGGDEWNTMAGHLQDRNWQDPVEQTRFVAGRLKGDIGNAQYANVHKALQNAKTPEEAAKIFASGYLKPAQSYLSSRIANINRGIPGIGFYTGAE